MKKVFQKMNKKRWTIFGIVAVVVVIAGVIMGLRAKAQAGAASQYQTAKVERGSLTATVGATGTVRANQSVQLVWQTTGTVEIVNFRIGDEVKAGDVMATLSKTSLAQNIILAEADLVNAQQAFDDLLKSDTARANAWIALRDAQDEYDQANDYRVSLNQKITIEEVKIISVRTPFGWRKIPRIKTYKGYADVETIADADARLALSKARLDDAQRAYERLKDGPNTDDLTAAQARIDAAQATINMACITAPFAGTVTNANLKPGDQVTAGSPAYRVDDLTHLLVDVDVSEVDINNISLDQPVTMSFDAILGKEYHGKVVEVAQVGTSVQGVVNFTVTVELTDADELVKPGMTAAVNVVVTELKDVILVPNRAVRMVDGKRVVYVLRDGQPAQVEIRLGASSDTMSVIVDGDLKVGELVVLNPPIELSHPAGGPGFMGGGGG